MNRIQITKQQRLHAERSARLRLMAVLRKIGWRRVGKGRYRKGNDIYNIDE